MNRLVEDVKVFFGQGIEFTDSRISLNDGVDLLPTSVAESSGYVNGSFIPKRSWRKLSIQEQQILLNTGDSSRSDWSLGESIGIIRLPKAVLQPLHLILEKSFNSTSASSLFFDQTEHPASVSRCIQDIEQWIHPYSLMSQQAQVLGLNISSTGLITTTKDRRNYLPHHPFTGLHIDSWESAPLRARYRSSNRLCINLGQETRYLLFINLTLMKMFQLLGLSKEADIHKYYRGAQIPQEFMGNFSSYPVIKLSLEPNEAYIAPTENIIHDASTLDKVKNDIILTFLGKFGMPQAEQPLNGAETIALAASAGG